MQTVIPKLYATESQPLSFAPRVGVRSFLLERDEGNIIVYSSATIRDEEETLREKGIRRQYMNHGHESWAGEKGSLWVAETFDAPLHAHEDESEEISGVQKVDETFSTRHTVGEDFEVIPIPGHTPGATAFLWETGEHRAIFTGDSIVLEDGEWVAALLDSSDREKYIQSLELVRSLDFDILVPWATSIDSDFYAFTDEEDKKRRVDELLRKMRRN